MKYILALLVSFAVMSSSLFAQVDDNPTNTGTVFSITVGDDTTVFEIDKNGDGVVDQTIEANIDLVGTGDPVVGGYVEYKLDRKRRKDGDDAPRKVQRWVKV